MSLSCPVDARAGIVGTGQDGGGEEDGGVGEQLCRLGRGHEPAAAALESCRVDGAEMVAVTQTDQRAKAERLLDAARDSVRRPKD